MDASIGNGRWPGLKLTGRVTLVASILLAIAAYYDDPSATAQKRLTPEAACKIQVEGVPNMAEVTPRLYRGGQPSEKGLENLAQMGINIVVDGRGRSRARKQERERVTRLGVRYVAIPWHCPFPKDDVFARFLRLIHENPDKKIFVHCKLGDDRVGMMIAAYRMAEEGWTAHEAMQEMKWEGFNFSHHFICPGLARYEKSFPSRLKTKPEFRSLR